MKNGGKSHGEIMGRCMELMEVQFAGFRSSQRTGFSIVMFDCGRVVKIQTPLWSLNDEIYKNMNDDMMVDLFSGLLFSRLSIYPS